MKKKFIAFFVLLLVVLSGCSLPGLGSGKSSIRVSGGVTSESQILANLVSGMIEHDLGTSVEIISNLGSANIMHNALLRGDIDIAAPRYTGTDVTGILQLPAEKDPEKALALVQKKFAKRYDQVYFPSYGFANNFVFMVTKETAEKYDLKTISDLQAIAGDLTAAVDATWLKRETDGYPAFIKEYNFDFKRVYPMQIGLVYDALASGKMDVVLGYSTDGRIVSYDLQILEDDHQFFPSYDASLVATEEILKEYPELEATLSKLTGQISTETMQNLNYQVDNDLLEPSNVAEKFLKENHYFEEK
ncbi:osmoprotectant ABC transporter substrate-binding protein [Carnobacterium mobile]|uniref:osmoprotectant ABC transporter substrate-binding protein n=1 Tax=Carnobacterium mobile TaxID=2750 RepID=UPI000552889F|nr:osmoprotectant ABC transporter substrate-binding protein [Carnobacterium mobile]